MDNRSHLLGTRHGRSSRPIQRTQIVDLLPNNANIYTPAYSIYEGGALARILLFNYVSDPSGSSDLTVQLNLNCVGAGGGPSQVQVKYLKASSVSQKGNFTWANQVFPLFFPFFNKKSIIAYRLIESFFPSQTFGDNFASDGRLEGTENIETIFSAVLLHLPQVHVPSTSQHPPLHSSFSEASPHPKKLEPEVLERKHFLRRL